MNAFQILSNYSFGYYNFVDLVDGAIEYLNRYVFQEMSMDEPGQDFWIEFLTYLQNEYVIEMLVDAVSLDRNEFMQSLDPDTYYGDTQAEINYFIDGISHEERAEEFRRMYVPTVQERVFDAWRLAYVARYGVDEIDNVREDEDEDELFEIAFYEVIYTYEEKEHFAQDNLDSIKNKVNQFAHKKIFRSQISEELIAEAMHPRRMMKQMNTFNDIEDFFESMGY
jgi:hypothetical protein